MSGVGHGSSGYEIERKWRLHRLPDRLVGADPGSDIECLRIRQGYLPPAEDADFAAFANASGVDVPRVGRIRSMEGRGGISGIRFIHTLKSGSGLVRREAERELVREAFEAAWPLTEGRRIEKVRWRIAENDVIWEVDRFDGVADLGLETGDLVLLEAEAADPEEARNLRPPAWLEEVIDREVTDDPAFTNAEIAFRGRPR